MKLCRSVVIVLVISTSIIIGGIEGTTAYSQQSSIHNITSILSKKTITTHPSSTTNVTPSNSKLLTYQNATYGIKFQYPPDWISKGSNNTISQDERIPTVVLLAPAKSASDDILEPSVGLKIEIQDRPLNNLSLYVVSTLNNLKRQNPSFQVIQSNPVTFAGNNSAYKVTFTANGQKDMAIFTIKDYRLYLIRYFAPVEKYSTYMLPIQKIIDSFELLNVNPQSSNTTLAGGARNLTQSFLMYQNSTYGISIQYPSDWQKEQISNGTAIRFHSPGSSILSILPPTLLHNTTLADYSTALTNSLKRIMNFTSSEVSSIAGNPAYKIVFSAKVGLSTIKQMHIITKKFNKEYTLIYTSNENQYPIDLPIVQRMLQSFKFN